MSDARPNELWRIRNYYLRLPVAAVCVRRVLRRVCRFIKSVREGLVSV